MIEVVFSESACGSLKAAQHYGEGKYQGGVSVIIRRGSGSGPTKEEIEAAQRKAEEKARLAWERAIPLGGNPADIYGYNLLLSVGDISENQPGIRRKQVLEHLYSFYPNGEGYQATGEIFKRVNESLETVRERAAAGESIRIWYSNQPDEMCGLYWFMGQLNQWAVHSRQASTIKLLEWEADDNGNIVRKNSWSEVAPEEWHRYLALQRVALPVLCQNCADWGNFPQQAKKQGVYRLALLAGIITNC